MAKKSGIGPNGIIPILKRLPISYDNSIKMEFCVLLTL